MLKMKVRKHYPYAEMRKMGNVNDEVSLQKFDALLQKLGELGMLEYDYGDKYTKEGPIPGNGSSDEGEWRLFLDSVVRPRLGRVHKHEQRAYGPSSGACQMFFERMTFLPLEHVTAMVPPG